MNILYAQEALPSHAGGLFLAGPTPRDPQVPSWRPAALGALVKVGYAGTVYVPEDRKGGFNGRYDAQVAWEWAALDAAAVVLFWVPRDLTTLPGFTTNVEFGLYARSGKAVLGYPPGAPKMRYLHSLADRFACPVQHTLTDTIKTALAALEKTPLSR
jgi:hypothetical protein